MTRTARIFIAETIGTMILILGGPGTVMFGQFLGFDIGVLGVSLAFGLSLLCAAYLFGHISGCHINPAVTLGMWALRRTAGRDVPTYLIGQILGAALGGFVIWAILASGDNPGGSRFVRASALRRSLERLRQPLAERLRARRGHHRRDRLDRAVHPRDRGHHAVLGHRGLRRHPDRPHAGPGPHDQHPDRQHVGEPGAQLRHRPVRGTSTTGGRSSSSGRSSCSPSSAGLVGALIWRAITTPEDEGVTVVVLDQGRPGVP